MECWRSFVIACRLLCKTTLDIQDVIVADGMLQRFCKKVQELFGPTAITPNMHLHGHLKEVIMDFGPLHSFWLFSYERFNGILGKYPNNNKCIEPQLMSKFSQDSTLLLSLPSPNMLKDFNTGTLFDHLESMHKDSPPEISLPSKCTRGTLSEYEVKLVQEVLSKVKKVSITSIKVNSCFRKYSSLSYCGVHLWITPKKVISPEYSDC